MRYNKKKSIKFKRSSHLEGYINWRKELGDTNESEDAIYHM